MQILSLQERKQPVEEYLNRKNHQINELTSLSRKGINYFINKLRVIPDVGILNQNLSKYELAYGKNQFRKKQFKTFFHFFLDAISDEILIILMISAVISIVVEGIYSQDKSTFWIDGFAILVAVAVCSLVASISDYQKQIKFAQLTEISQHNNTYSALRGGVIGDIHRDQILVGDIVLINSGIELPADGIILEAANLIVDESSITGESHEMYKNTLEMCVKNGVKDKYCPTPVLLSGSEIISGEGKMLVLLIGKDSQMGKLHDFILNQEDQPTPLEEKLDVIAQKIGQYGLWAGIFVFLILTAQLFLNEVIPNGWNTQINAPQLIKNVMLAITIIVVAIPEGLPLAVTISLAFSVKKLLNQNNLVRKLVSCETMGSAHIICTDKTGTLTQNDMHVVQIWNGKSHVNEGIKSNSVSDHINKEQYEKLVFECIVQNSSAVLSPKEKGSPTEIALLRYAELISSKNISQERLNYGKGHFLRLPFDSNRKRFTTGISINQQRYVFMSGAPEIIIQACSKMIDVKANTGECLIRMKEVENQITRMTTKGLRAVAICYKKISDVDVPRQNAVKDRFGIEEIETQDFTLLLIAGIKDLPRPESKHAIEQCKKAGVTVIMVTGDSTATARNIANQVSITHSQDITEGLCMEGSQFENIIQLQLTPELLYQRIKNLKILARSRPQHKYQLVVALKKLNYVVAVTGDGTNDVPALLKADVGVAMGITGTQIAKNAADILILDDNFNSIVRALVWGRNIFDSVRKFVQFQLTVNLTACLLTLITSLVFKQSIFNTIQMLWVNIIMDSFAALALATEPPNTEELLSRKPIDRNEGIITKRMIKHVIGQTTFQIIVIMVLTIWGHLFLPEFQDEFDVMIGADLSAKYYNGQAEGTMANGLDYPLFGYQSYQPSFQKYAVYPRHLTFIYNTYILMQAFNFLNCRRIHDQVNIFEGIFLNYAYLLIVGLTFGFQFVILYFLDPFFKLYNFHGLTSQQWLISILIAANSIVVSLVLRYIPYGKQEDNANKQQNSSEKEQLPKMEFNQQISQK